MRSRWLDIGQVLFLRAYGPVRRAIRFILPARGASHIINSFISICFLTVYVILTFNIFHIVLLIDSFIVLRFKQLGNHASRMTINLIVIVVVVGQNEFKLI